MLFRSCLSLSLSLVLFLSLVSVAGADIYTFIFPKQKRKLFVIKAMNLLNVFIFGTGNVFLFQCPGGSVHRHVPLLVSTLLKSGLSSLSISSSWSLILYFVNMPIVSLCSGPDNVRSPLKEENDYISNFGSLTSVHTMIE